jgi:hypothetical protein
MGIILGYCCSDDDVDDDDEDDDSQGIGIISAITVSKECNSVVVVIPSQSSRRILHGCPSHGRC